MKNNRLNYSICMLVLSCFALSPSSKINPSATQELSKEQIVVYEDKLLQFFWEERPHIITVDDIKFAIEDFFIRDNYQNIRAILDDLFDKEMMISDIRSIVARQVQEGKFLKVFKVALYLKDGRYDFFALNVPTQYGEVNDLAKDDYLNLVVFHNKYPDKVVRPIIMGKGEVPPLRGGKDINIFALEWLGDYMELNDDYYGSGRFMLNNYGREEEFKAQLKPDIEYHFNILNAIVKSLVEMSEYNPKTRKIDFISQASLGAGDFMFKPLEDGGFELKLVTIRSVARDRDTNELLDYLLGNRYCFVYYPRDPQVAFLPEEVLVGILQGLAAKFGREEGIRHFKIWAYSYYNLLKDRQMAIRNLLTKNKLDENLEAWLAKSASVREFVETRHFEREINEIKRFLSNKKIISDTFREGLEGERALAKAVCDSIERFLFERSISMDWDRLSSKKNLAGVVVYMDNKDELEAIGASL